MKLRETVLINEPRISSSQFRQDLMTLLVEIARNTRGDQPPHLSESLDVEDIAKRWGVDQVRF